MNELSRTFHEHFELVDANGGELLEQACRLRYRILCVEEQVPDFEPDRFPDGIESDAYDGNAVHTLLRYRPSGEFIGTVRLVMCDPQDPTRPFPIETFAGAHFDPRLIDPAKLPRRHTAEISRLVLMKQFRSRRGESHYIYGGISRDQAFVPNRRRSAQPFLGLIAAVIRMTSLNSITHWYAGMEPSLNVNLARFGLQLNPIGPLLDYHGPRRPHLGVVDEVLASTYRKDRHVWELLTEDGTLWPAPDASRTAAGG